MYALIPCPEVLLDQVKQGFDSTKGMEGFWLVSQDPSLISQVGVNAICAESVDGLREEVDKKFQLPYGFSRLSKEKVSNYNWVSSYSHGEEPVQFKSKKEFLQKCVKEDDKWTVFALLDSPKVIDETLTEYDVLAEAKRRKFGIYTELFDIKDDGHKVEPIKEDYILERTPLGIKVVYNPKRAKRLSAIRNSCRSTGRRYPNNTCFGLILKLASELRSIVRDNSAINSLYREYWTGRGLSHYSLAVVNFYKLATQLRLKNKARKIIKPFILELSIYKRLINANCSCQFKEWYNKELAAIGEPKDKNKYYTRVKSLK